MLFDSLPFLAFFVLVFFLYFLLPKGSQKWLVLLASCYFYMAFIPEYLGILFFLITVDFFLGIRIERALGRERILYFALSLLANIGTLFFFKYFNFFNENIATLASIIHWNYPLDALSIILPIGLSFHVFQSLAYVIEVFRGRFPAERNYGTYALYVMFFPQLVAGPIERPGHLLPQLRLSHSFDYDRAVSGLKLMLWGFFKKIVIANNLAILVDHVYGNLATSDGSAVALAVFLFAIQLYADFSGYSDIAIGSARMLGIELTQNFRQPYFARSLVELWRRWHISLSSWFRDYVYQPLLWWKRGWGASWLYCVIIVTFLLTGVWHGAGWNFIALGLFFGVGISLGLWTKPFRDQLWDRMGFSNTSHVRTLISIGVTFLLTTCAWVFFRAPDLTHALLVFERIFSTWDLTYLTCTNYCAVDMLGVGKTALAMTGVSVGILFIHELVHELRLSLPLILKRRLVRWPAYYAFILWMLYTGDFAPKTFIYFQF